MDILADFIFGALTGVAGNTVYDHVKNILGVKLHPKLEDAANNKNMEKFLIILETAMDANEEIKLQLENLQKGRMPNINQMNNIFGDNVGGNKIIHSKQ